MGLDMDSICLWVMSEKVDRSLGSSGGITDFYQNTYPVEKFIFSSFLVLSHYLLASENYEDHRDVRARSLNYGIP